MKRWGERGERPQVHLKIICAIGHLIRVPICTAQRSGSDSAAPFAAPPPSAELGGSSAAPITAPSAAPAAAASAAKGLCVDAGVFNPGGRRGQAVLALTRVI